MTNPDLANAILAIFDGWNSGSMNYDPVFKDSQPLLLTIWYNTESIGNKEAYRMQYMISSKAIRQRYYMDNSKKWSEWAI